MPAAGLDYLPEANRNEFAQAGRTHMSFAYFDWIAHHAEVRGDKTALVDLATRRRLTYRAFDERIDRLATHLAALGAGRGERVAVLAPNTTDILEVQFACFRLASIFVPLNTRLTVHELQYILGDARAGGAGARP
jgi:fatty-acyl-CoA synthase